MERVNLAPFVKQVQKISDTEVPTEFHAKDAQFLAEQEFMEVIINYPDYFSSSCSCSTHVLSFVHFVYFLRLPSQ